MWIENRDQVDLKINADRRVEIISPVKVIHVCTTSEHLHTTMFPDSIVTRPYDIAPLVLFGIAGVFIYPRFHRRTPMAFPKKNGIKNLQWIPDGLRNLSGF